MPIEKEVSHRITVTVLKNKGINIGSYLYNYLIIN